MKDDSVKNMCIAICPTSIEGIDQKIDFNINWLNVVNGVAAGLYLILLYLMVTV